MYPNLFKQFSLPKLCNDISSKTGDIVSQIEGISYKEFLIYRKCFQVKSNSVYKKKNI